MKYLALTLLLGWPSHAAIVIKDVTVIDVVGGSAQPHRNVVIKGDRIASIGAAIPPGARIVNGRGRFLIPGLWNMHVHLASASQFPEFIAHGVTGVEDMGSDFARVSAWRQEIESGKTVGPHIITSGPAVAGQSPDGLEFPVLAAAGPRDARRVFDRLWDMNVDFIKIQPDLSADSYFALAEQARHWHLRVVGAVPLSISAWDAIEAHQSSLENLSSVRKAVSTDAEAIHFFEECATRGIRITPLLVESGRTAPDHIRDLYRLVALSTRTRVEVLAGSGDGASVQDELEQLADAGMTAGAALRAATIAPAQFLGSDDELGAIAAGKLADLVLLDANPLVDIRNTRKIAAVFSRGKYFSRPALTAMLARQ
ncbi:MAG TPA: amidohydrolase family protein [Bryobacteraceae bacterium]|nr:amidohydrolase family protein [Bryobacteraceae bacterium]